MQVSHDTVDRITHRGQDYWVVFGKAFNDDGTPMVDADGNHFNYKYRFPVDTMEWRAAEYGIDPADTATLLDIVMVEPLMSEEDYQDGVKLHDTDDIAQARADHLARVARKKLAARMSTRKKGSPLQRIADESPMHPEIVAIKRLHVKNAIRQNVPQKARKLTEDPEAARLEHWKQRSKPLIGKQEDS